MEEFLIARNPDRESSLPFLVRLPIDGGIWLKARESWPRASRVYCHPAEPVEIEGLEIVERVPVRACVRRGPTIDLILERSQNRRSQFVFTSQRGRPLIFWQTAKAALSARPGVRIPFSPAPTAFAICIDTRERYPYRFAGKGVTTERRPMRAGDYGIVADERVVAAVERKTLEDFAHCLNDGSLDGAMSDLETVSNAAVVIEGSYSALLRMPYARAGYLIDLVARLQVRHPSIPLVFLESRKLAEEWTFRFLRAAASHRRRAELPLLHSAAEPLRPKQPGRKRARKPPAP